MTKSYTVTLVTETSFNVLVGTYKTIEKAMAAAKRAAKTRRDCVTYGPSSIAYIGIEATAVVAW